MSKQKENQFIESVHDYLLTKLPYHMKNHNEYVGGIADVWYSGAVSDMWIEYKYLEKLPPRKLTLKLTALQKEWLKDRYYENRRVYVVLGTKAGAYLFCDVEWEKSFDSKIIAPRLKKRKELAKWIAEQTVGHYMEPEKRGKKLRRL